MGYRSNVGLCLKNDYVEKLQKNEKLTKLLNDANIFTSKTATLYIWEDIKWYNEYPEIREIETFISGLNDEDYYQILIGEELNDTEINGNYYDNPFGFDLIRDIIYDKEPYEGKLEI